MKPLMMLLKREWLEWQRVVIGTILVITFLNFLMLLSVARGSSWFHEMLEQEGHMTIENGQIDIRMNDGEVEVYIEGEEQVKEINHAMGNLSKELAVSTRIGLQGTFIFVLFLSLFYFSDALYKERADNSTLFFRSLPVSDHYLLGSKIVAGLIGVTGLTLFLSLEYLLFIRVAVVIWGQPLNMIAAAVFSQISYIGLIWDWVSYLIYAAIRMTPLALFLMLVGTYVKGRPLLVGIGGPILLAISWSIIFKSAAIFKIIGKFFWGFNTINFDSWKEAIDGTGDVPHTNLGDYILNLETLGVLMASGLLYYVLWLVYRKNLPTG